MERRAGPGCRCSGATSSPAPFTNWTLTLPGLGCTGEIQEPGQPGSVSKPAWTEPSAEQLLAACARDPCGSAPVQGRLAGLTPAPPAALHRPADGLYSDWRSEARRQPRQHRHAHRGQPGRPHHAVHPGLGQQLLLQTQSVGGLILSKTISKQQYKGMAIFTPVICGVGGNLVAIQTSRISTYLHIRSAPGVLPPWMKKFWPNPCSTFCTSEVNSMSARVLLFLVVPGHLIFFYIIYLVEGQSVTDSKSFVVLYLLAGLIQVTILLYLAEVMVRLTWHQALDPDNHCIPYLTGLGDLLGTGLLALCFLVDWLLRSKAELADLSELASGPP
uniref:Solute carrier family 41 member n=1 Tax=Oryctolagus cuniculus TaxID=9986 RepID=A0A5F9CV09_RABIT